MSAVEARKRLGSILDEVRLRGTTFVIERDGRPAAAVVPLSVLDKLDQEREASFRQIDELRERIAERVSGAEFEAALNEEFEAVRAARRSASARTT